MAEKVTVMKLKVDLQCEKCYKKVKKVLSKFPQIRGQVFDDKQNIVTITVVCCSPEKIRDKLCYKGGGSITSIEIVEPPKPKPESDKKKETEKPKGDAEKKKDQEKPKGEPEKKKEPEKKTEDKPKTDAEKPKPQADKPKDKPADPPKSTPKIPDPVPVYPIVPPPPMAVPVGLCCVPCYENQPGGPCYHGYGGAPLSYDGYYGRPVYDSYGGARPYVSASRCDQYFSEENASGCSIM